MEETVRINDYKRCLISKDNLILEVDRGFLDLIRYTQSELVGKTLAEIGEILRIDSQIDLQYIEDDTTIFIFTKELVAIEGTISCEIIGNGSKKVFSFKIHNNDSINGKFDLTTQFATTRGDGVALFSYPGELLINSNQNYLNFLEQPYNKRSNSIGKNIKEIISEYWDTKFDNIQDNITKACTPYHIEEICFYSRITGDQYWNITIVPILEQGITKYFILSLANVTEKVLNRKSIEQNKEELEVIIDNISDKILIFDKNYNISTCNKMASKIPGIDNPYVKNLNDITTQSIIYDKDNKLIAYGNFPFQRVAKGEFISDYVIKTSNSSAVVYREVDGSPIYDKNGVFSGGVMVYRDIKNRIQKEETRLIKTQNDLLSKVVEALDF